MYIDNSRSRILKSSPLCNENGLVLWWPFADGTATDASGHGLKGTLNGSPVPVPDILIPSLKFDGSTSYIESNDIAGLPSGAASRTLMAWFKTESGGGSWRTIVAYGGRANPNWFALVLNTSDHLNASLFGNDIATSTTDSDGNWHHGAITFDGTTRTLYLDGLSKATSTSTVNTTLADPFLVGRNQSSGEYFPGPIGDVRLYNRCLSPAEIQSIYSRAWAYPLSLEKDVSTLNVPGILFDAASNSTYKTAASTYSWSHTCTGSNRYLTVGVSMLSVAGSSVSGITYNGVALSLIKAQASVSGAVRAELWGLTAPSSGSNTIAVTLTAALDSIGGAVSFTGVHQVSPYEAANSATATNVGAADATVDVTTVADNDWCIDVVATDDTSITVGAGQTSRNNVTGTLGSGAMSTEGPKTPGGAVTMSWTAVGALATWSIASVALRPTSASTLNVTLTASKGTFVETGIVSLFRISTVVTKGTFTETGKAVLFDFDLPANKGTFTESGKAVLFDFNEVVSKGTFTYTGVSAQQARPCGKGTFTETGQSITFKFNEVDAVGAFILSGKNATLTPSMVSSKGTFAETGKAILFDFDMNMSKGTFTLIGQEATLTDTGGPAPSASSDIITLRRRRRS